MGMRAVRELLSLIYFGTTTFLSLPLTHEGRDLISRYEARYGLGAAVVARLKWKAAKRVVAAPEFRDATQEGPVHPEGALLEQEYYRAQRLYLEGEYEAAAVRSERLLRRHPSYGPAAELRERALAALRLQV